MKDVPLIGNILKYRFDQSLQRRRSGRWVDV